MSDLVSIIIPTFNRGYIIGQTLESVLSQTYKNWECIIVDDGSTDNSQEIIFNYIKKDNRFKYYKRPLNYKKGANGCRNFGYEVSNGTFIKWFDSDDILLSNALEASSQYFSNTIDVIISSLEYVNYEREKIDKKHFYFSENLIDDYLIGKISFYTITPIWNRNFLLQNEELFDENLGNMDDWDFNLRMLYQNPKIKFIDEILVQYRLHENSLSNEINKLNLNEINSEFDAIDKHLALLKNNKKASWKILHHHAINRHKYILRSLLIKKDTKKYYYLKRLLIKQLQICNIKDMFKYIIIFSFYSSFNKGYKYL